MSSAISLSQLAFDPSDSADSQNVGAYLRAGSDGDLLSSTNVGGKEGLDVNLITASIVVTATQLDIDDLNATDDAVASWLKDGSGNSISSTGGALDVNISNASVVVSATDLDIRDLTHVSDSVKVGDGTDFLAVNGDGSINAVVTATQLDIDDLSAGTDSVAAWLSDGAGTALTSTLVGSDQALDVNVVQTVPISVQQDAFDTIANSAIAVGATEVQVIAGSPVANRRQVVIQNTGSDPVWLGATGVTTSSGIELAKKASIVLDASTGIYAIAAGAAREIRIIELGYGA